MTTQRRLQFHSVQGEQVPAAREMFWVSCLRNGNEATTAIRLPYKTANEIESLIDVTESRVGEFRKQRG